VSAERHQRTRRKHSGDVHSTMSKYPMPNELVAALVAIGGAVSLVGLHARVVASECSVLRRPWSRGRQHETFHTNGGDWRGGGVSPCL